MEVFGDQNLNRLRSVRVSDCTTQFQVRSNGFHATWRDMDFGHQWSARFRLKGGITLSLLYVDDSSYNSIWNTATKALTNRIGGSTLVPTGKSINYTNYSTW